LKSSSIFKSFGFAAFNFPFIILDEALFAGRASFALKSFSLFKAALVVDFITASVACFVSSGFSLFGMSIFLAVGCLVRVSF
jgi:hypothetical protein